MSRHFYPMSNQSGVALITVLLFLVLIMIVGAIAVRQASIDFNVAASDQVGTLLLNNSDSLLAHIEVAVSDQDSASYAEVMSQKNGALGHFTVSPGEKIGEQLSLCYRPTEDRVFDIDRAYVRKLGTDNNFISERTSCNADSANDYNSKRNTSMTQLIVQGLPDQSSDHFNNAERARSNAANTNSISPRVQMNSVSVLPAMSDKNADVIQKCLGRPVGDANKYGVKDGNVNDCLKTNNIPSTFVVEEGVIEEVEVGGYTGTEVASPCETGTGSAEETSSAVKNCKAALTGG